MDFICYLHPGWKPLIRPATATRKWMDETAEAFAYRCLPLNIANAHGWEILAPTGTTAYWTGGTKVDDVVVQADAGDTRAPVSLFGQGMLTFHIEAIFRTPPGWDLWICGSPNHFKDGLSPLTGVVETDWSPYSFTMNWKFTRRNHWVRFAKHEPICFIFPVQRGALECLEPKFVTLTEDSEVSEQFHAWSRSRDAFHEAMKDGKIRSPAEKWQKRYYRGITMDSDTPVPGHRAKLRLKPFVEALPNPLGEEISVERKGAEQTREPIDEVWLTKMLTNVVEGLSATDGRVAVKRALTEAGFPAAVAERLADALTRPTTAATEATNA